MRILAIETSCDDTCVAILENSGKKGADFKILSNIVSSQVKIHAKYGGVYPTLAVREHERNLPIVLKKALKGAGILKNPKPDAIAVTIGPGLDPCLWTGINFAKKLAQEWNIPLIPVNHIEGHILANFLEKIRPKFQITNDHRHSGIPSGRDKIQSFPAVCLIASGGHTQIILMEKIGKYKIIGETRDDAAGECFDKSARIIGLPYPGGPAIAAEATKISNFKFQISQPKADLGQRLTSLWLEPRAGNFGINLPRPMIYQKNYDFSFSGLKTAVLYEWQKRNTPPRRGPASEREKYIQALCFEIQQAIIDTLIHKTLKAVKDFRTKTIILGGGVTANKELRRKLKAQSAKRKVKVFVPAKNFSMDNASMIAVAGFFNQKKATKNYKKIRSNPNLQI